MLRCGVRADRGPSFAAASPAESAAAVQVLTCRSAQLGTSLVLRKTFFLAFIANREFGTLFAGLPIERCCAAGGRRGCTGVRGSRSKRRVAMCNNRLFAVAATVFLATMPAMAHGQWVIGTNFTGSTYGVQSSFFPPDTMGAIGPNHFVETLNGSFRVYDRTGTPLLSKSLDQFWKDATGTQPNWFSFDPRILYDASTSRWFASALDNAGVSNNAILLAVSTSADPTGAWTGFRIDSDPVTKGHWADFDTLGMNGQGIYISVNAFKTSAASNGITIAAFNKASLIGGSLSGTVFFNNNPNDTGYSVQPIVDTTGGGTPQNLYSAYNAPAGKFKLSTITGPNEGNSLNVSGGLINVTPYNDPPLAAQNGGPNNIEAGDTRLGSNLVRVGGNVWGVETVASGGRSALRWFRIDPNTNTIAEEGIIGDATHDYYEGSIAVNSAGDVVIGYTRSGDTEYASSYASTGFFNGVSTSFDAPMLLKAGVASYDVRGNGRNRWGDYSATMVDPTNPAHFWTIQEWASAQNVWSTQITELVKGPGGAVPVSGWQTTLIGAGLAAFGWMRRRRALEA